jgi:sarcosine oxidase subunit delta
MRLPCPFCGLRDEGEFSYEGPATDWPALDAPRRKWVEAVFLRAQPKGRDEELWRHHLGCGAWLVIERDNVSHAVHGVRLARAGEARALLKRDRRA